MLAVFALSYGILILSTGCTKISEIATVRAVPAVPIMMLVAARLSKLFSRRFCNNPTPQQKYC